MDWTLEVVLLPASDLDRSIAFYRDKVGFQLDHDTVNEQMHVAQLTPPVGFNLFVVQGLTGRDILYVARSVLPFFALLCAAIVILTIYPQLVTWLPTTMFSVARSALAAMPASATRRPVLARGSAWAAMH